MPHPADGVGPESEPADDPSMLRFALVRRSRVRAASDQRPATRLAIGDALEVPAQRVVKRRPIRPEILVSVLGIVLVAAAILKPWGESVPARSVTTPGQSEALQTDPIALSLLADASGRPGPQDTGGSRYYGAAWQAVDWTVVTVPDGHSGWGVAAASLPFGFDPAGLALAPKPDVQWLAAPSGASHTTFPVARGSRVFAFAITWPRDEVVTNLTVNYTGSMAEPPYVASGGLEAYTDISPLPATAVVPTQRPPLPTTGVASGRPISSGQFWVPPTDASPLVDAASPARSWSTLPWPWPMGHYKVTIDTSSGAITMGLTLQDRA